ncbi:uridylate kinase [Sulfolobales archaeon HS-7]|nr:uridylate kinase [Sulfolobales archaeon HS-7]
MNITIKISGKFFDQLLYNRNPEDYVTRLRDMIFSLTSEGHRIFLVVGGGEIARNYISIGRKLNLNEFSLDIIGIYASRLNAVLLSYLLNDDTYPLVPTDMEDFLQAFSNKNNKVIVIGGLQPGQSTSGVAALIAESTRSEYLIDCTNVDGIYDKDPSKNNDAKILSSVNVKELEKILSNVQGVNAGTYELIDPLAIKIIKRARIKTFVIHFNDIDKIPFLVRGKLKIGSEILVSSY